MGGEALEWLRQQIGARLEAAQRTDTIGQPEESARIAANHPLDTVARCEAELAILDRCEAVLAAFSDPAGGRWPDVTRREASHAGAILADMAAGYRHWPGYANWDG